MIIRPNDNYVLRRSQEKTDHYKAPKNLGNKKTDQELG